MSWNCSICSSSEPLSSTYCSICLFSRPMDRKGIPQIFAGYSIHFNGVIPRTLMHPSHAVEWRMAERHGAVCMMDFTSDVNLLVYRPGYERSDKCRRCVESGPAVAVSIRWMLDSLLETRQIHPSIHQLKFIPDVATATPKGTDLPHYQHPYFVLKAKEYAIPTSFPPTMLDILDQRKEQQELENARVTSKNDSKTKNAANLTEDASSPPFYDVPPLTQSMLDVYDSALSTLKSTNNNKSTDGEFIGDRKERTGVEIVASEQHRSKVDTMLFSGMTMLISPALASNSSMRELLSLTGAKVILGDENLSSSALRDDATHVVYHRDDKKSNFLISAAHIKQTKRPGLLLCESSWIEDCLLLGEVIPPYSMYAPSAKLMETLQKKFEKGSEKVPTEKNISDQVTPSKPSTSKKSSSGKKA